MIQCICSYFNFTNNQLRKQLYIDFRKRFTHPLITIEIALDKNSFFIEDSYKILANHSNLLWQKERSFNIVLENLSDKYDKIVWVDTDIIFHNENWLNELDKLLDDHLIAQPFESVFENGHINNKGLNANSWSKCFYDYQKNNTEIPQYYALGLSWGFRRSCIHHGFFDKHILGSNDALQTLAILGDCFNKQLLKNCTTGLIYSWIDYSKQIPYYRSYDIGYCSGKVEHMYHGQTCHRGYQIREQLLSQYNFDPIKHIELDSNKLYKITDDNLLLAIQDYFQSRHRGTYDNIS